jgi:hypothetical protein
MKIHPFAISPFEKNAPATRRLLGILWLALSLATAAVAQSGQPEVRRAAAPKKAISAAEFSRMVRSFSEEEGNFASDNYISNETGYLYIVEKMKQMGVTGGAYIGVGPEQNFTYIAKIRPEIAFIVDIRRQAIIQHLMYKAIFQMAPDPAHFLSLLFSRPLDAKGAPGRDTPIEAVVEYFADRASPIDVYSENLSAIRKTIEKDFEFPLSEHDAQLLEHVYSAFRQGNLQILTRWYGGGYGGGYYGGFPTLKDLILATDLNGKQGNFLASREDYEFLRNLHRNNRIIPVVGDFAGTKALAVVADYLKENGYTVSAYYTSNVEQYLFGDQVFGAFAENIRKLPINDQSVFIRSIRTGWRPRSTPISRMATVLEKMAVFVKDFEAGLYTDYRSLMSTHVIFPNEP